MKYYRYAKCMREGKHPHSNLLIGEFGSGARLNGSTGEVGAEGKLTRDWSEYAGTIRDLIDLAFVLIKGKHKRQIEDGYICTVSKCQVEW